MGPWLSEGCLKVAEKSYGQGYVLPGCKNPFTWGHEDDRGFFLVQMG